MTRFCSTTLIYITIWSLFTRIVHIVISFSFF